MKKRFALAAFAALALAMSGCGGKKAQASGPTTGDGIPVDTNAADNNAAP